MKLSNILVLLPMAILLAFAVACGGGIKHKADYTWPFSTGTISFSEVECCERKTGVLGKQWLGSGIVENATERALWMQFTIEFSGEDGLVLADVYTTEITLLSDQKGKVIFGLFHFDYDDIESFKRVSVKTEYRD